MKKIIVLLITLGCVSCAPMKDASDLFEEVILSDGTTCVVIFGPSYPTGISCNWELE